ncbi:MAG: aldo/keto reductase [Candidatus Omnitrophica bacterium]|nr:aldo/keto reductase [Candidatus Omnitrophota bacterium]
MVQKKSRTFPQISFGRTGYQVSRLGFGAMRLPTRKNGQVDFDRAAGLIRDALKRGVNFIDTHHFYHNGESEEAIGQAITGFPRDKLILQTKIGMYNNYTEKQCWQLLEKALEKMRTEYIDFYLTHSLSWKHYLQFNRLFMKVTDRAMAQGLIRFRGFSSHDRPENVKKFIRSGHFSTITVQYNLINREYKEVIDLAWEKGLGVVIMGPVAGGLLGSPEPGLIELLSEEAKHPAALALRFVLTNPHVHVALSGMSTLRQVRENVASVTTNQPLSPDEISQINLLIERRKKFLDLPCTGCGYCLPCPHQVRIPFIFRQYNLAQVFGIPLKARKIYSRLKPEERASACVACRRCEKKCPQKIKIADRLEEIRAYFGS